MKITSARVIVTCPGRNFVTLKIETDQGVYGIGDATLNGREKAVVSYLEDHVIRALSAWTRAIPRTSGNISIAGRTGAAGR
jgi:L-alanine-DL-glutamate epimerase-like enolase superfamily enzyme